MSTRVSLRHETLYRYDKLITLGPQLIRLKPSPHSRTPVAQYRLELQPAAHKLYWQQDPFGNFVARVLVPEKTDVFGIVVELETQLTPVNPFDFLLEPAYELFPFTYAPELSEALTPFLRSVEPSPALRDFVDSLNGTKRRTVSVLIDLITRVRDQILYTSRLESGIQSPEETLRMGSGSCRDSSWLCIEALRQLGFAARFVSGYLIQLAAEPEGADSADLHAWLEVFIPGAGWLGLDPTSGLLTAEGHMPLVCTPHPAQAAPITGTVEPSGVDFRFALTVERLPDVTPDAPAPLSEVNSPSDVPASASFPPSPSSPSPDPRVADRLDDRDWDAVQTVARKVDADLAAGDVRLTMGGEPTFVGVDEPDSPQWNGAALGELKRERAVVLIKRLRERMTPGALLHFGQGKWYPGEALPRWAMHCFWRNDGVPIWQNAALVADDQVEYGFTLADAEEFVRLLARRLQVSAANILPAYEDALFRVWQERKLPVNVDVFDSKLANEREREEMARVFAAGLGTPAGYVLPIRRRQLEGRLYWSSQLWSFRPERLILLPGDSPVGFRLPLDSLPWVTPDDIDYDYDVDPFAPRDTLPPRVPRLDLLTREAGNFEDPQAPEPVTKTAPGESAKEVIRPALSVQVRDGRVHVFLPYTTQLHDYLDLVTAVEDVCAFLRKPVWLEGYTPPADPRLRSFSLTPDPGVLEVNLPPAANWEELESVNALVWAQARECRLTAEKFGYDGRHTATNGGNHVVLGGPTAADSPLLRRPDLLRSMVAFWQNHPALSYLFSGTFIGPTSQYPRVDEARMDSLYELEIAFSQLPTGECPPWLVDRLFRNLLVDMTGNTHRAEFCIDKLYPPQGSGSRLGLLELRAFEMPPDLRMGLAQLLLIRALVAMFWTQPYAGRLIRWGTELHDRFLLPHFVEKDLADVLTTVQRFGYAIRREWFAAQLEFRFPRLGSVAAEGIVLELRQALEPWHVLGEEASGSGTVRSVDSSLERLQAKVTGWIPERYVLVCNGRHVPLRSTGVNGEAVAGVRYRAWLPPSALHPTIPVHTPLVFDIVDTWNERTIAGCTYHVVHPEGHWYSTRPADAGEAASRRAERFQAFGHPLGPMKRPDAEENPSLPMTLDLRWPPPGDLSSVGVPPPGGD